MIKTHIIHKLRDGQNKGFSLLEVLVALAIISLVSLGLFQSMTSMLAVSQKAVTLTEKTLDDAIIDRSISKLVSGLIPNWPEKEAERFLGGAKTFQGFSTNLMSSRLMEESTFELFLVQNNRGYTNLVYESEGESEILKNDLPPQSHFLYLDKELSWSKIWPPPQSRDVTNLDILMPYDLKALPLAIGLKISETNFEWVYFVDEFRYLPDRLELDR